MKKISTIFAAVLCAASIFAANYGILVNGSMYFAGEPAGTTYDEYQQYLAHVQVKSGDYCQLCDAGNSYAVWAVNLDQYSVDGFTRSGDQYNVTVTGCYDFYIKLKYQSDMLYIGNGSNCGEGVDVSGHGSGDDPEGDAPKFYVTGDSALMVDAGYAVTKAWNADALPSATDTFTLSLKAGVNYKLKITTNGLWATAKGYTHLTEKAEGLHHVDGNDNNIGFKLAAAGDVKVIYTGSIFKLVGNFYVPQVENVTLKLVPSEEWKVADAKFAAWLWGDNIEAQWTQFFAPVAEDSDTLQVQIPNAADSVAFIRFSPRATEPTWVQSGEDVLVWGETKDKIDYSSLVWTIVGWDEGQWTPLDRPCESYGLMVGDQYVPGKKNVLQSEWTEYMVRGVELTAGQRVKLCNACADYATWVEETFAATSYEFAIQDGAYVVADNGKYDFYLKFIGFGNNEIYVSKEGTYTTAVREQCTDVLMQAFYNESYNSSAPGVSDSWAIGDTKWNTLLAQADTLGKYFDLIWLPPSANGDGMGYHPKNYGNQSSNWGSATQLTDLIGALHNAGAKVVADIVINHCQSSSGWMGFPEFDFGTYGKFQPVGAWICQNDEVNTDPGSDSQGQATGPYDDGENWSGARDWAHSNVEVQAMFKAYLKWMREEVGYDGFRYDKGDGFNNWHHDNYNKAAGPYIAFMECYSGTDEIQWRISQANYNLMALDFDTKWHVFNSIAGWDYSRGRGDGLLGRSWGRYAVEFIDSHDWFLRGDNENEFGGRGNSLTEAMKCRLLQANAFMLSMPGVPCVFYPHWKKYDGFIKPMIQARKLAGVHSESEVKDESATANGYQATIVGKDGFLILCLGDKAHQSFEGFTCMASYYEENDCNMGKDASYQIWVKRTTPMPTAIDNEIAMPEVTKFIKNGQLFIRCGEKVYDVMGNKIQ